MGKFKVIANMMGVVKKIQTISTGDGDFRITIDVPKSSKNAVMELMGREGQEVLGFTISKEDPDEVESDHESEF